VSTAGVHILPEILADSRFNGYGPCPMSPREFFRMLRRTGADYSQFLFIDFGCGKGQPLFLASELPFKAVIGIEFTALMVQAAEENIRTYSGPRRSGGLRVICINALDYELPPEPSIYYFCDPFVAVVMTQWVERLRQSLASAPRQIFIVYMLPSYRRVMDQSGFLTLVEESSSHCIYRAP
jgi:SAM-dependent methyltransferase